MEQVNAKHHARFVSGKVRTLPANVAHEVGRQVARAPASPDRKDSNKRSSNDMWEFPKIRGTLFWDPYNKDPTI